MTSKNNRKGYWAGRIDEKLDALEKKQEHVSTKIDRLLVGQGTTQEMLGRLDEKQIVLRSDVDGLKRRDTVATLAGGAIGAAVAFFIRIVGGTAPTER